MNTLIQTAIRTLSENIAKTTRDKTITASVDALKNVGIAQIEAREDVLLDELAKYINESISAEFGRLLALMEISEKKPDTMTVIKQALQENVRDIPVTEIGLSSTAIKSIAELGCTTIGELTDANPVDVMDAHGLGGRSYISIINFLRLRGIDWPGELTDEQIRARRYERLDKLSLNEFYQALAKQKYGASTDKHRFISVLPVKDLRAYTMQRLASTPDEQIYQYEFNSIFKMFSKLTLWELQCVGIKTFRDLLPLTMKEFKDCKFSKKVDLEVLVSNVNAGLALIGRKLED